MKRQIHSYLTVIIGTICILIVAGCTKQFVTIQALQYNKAISQNIYETILLNAVRSSIRQGGTYTAVGNLEGTLNRNATLGVSWPITEGDIRTLTLTSGLDNDLNNTVSHVNLNQSEFLSNIRKEITPETLDYYINNGWPRDVIYMLSMNRIDITIADLDIIWENAFREARSNSRRALTDGMNELTKFHGFGCKRVFKRMNDARDRAERKTKREMLRWHKSKTRDERVVTVWNNPRQPCSYIEFRNLILAMKINRLQTTTVSGDGKWKNTTRKVIKSGLKHKTITEQKWVGGKSKTALTILGRNSDNSDIVFHLRSPDAMIAYLGDFIAAKNYIGFNPKIKYGINFEETELFNVVKGPLPGSPVSVVDAGTRFSVVRPNYGASNEDQSLAAMTLISQLIALQTAKDAIISPQTITLTN